MLSVFAIVIDRATKYFHTSKGTTVHTMFMDLAKQLTPKLYILISPTVSSYNLDAND